MNTSSSPAKENVKTEPSSEARRRIDAAAWALFFIWAGISILANIGWGWFLVGIGVIVLAAQAALRLFGEKPSGSWLICGVVLLAAGLWEIGGVRWPLAALLMILLGVGVLWHAFFGKPASKP